MFSTFKEMMVAISSNMKPTLSATYLKNLQSLKRVQRVLSSSGPKRVK